MRARKGAARRRRGAAPIHNHTRISLGYGRLHAPNVVLVAKAVLVHLAYGEPCTLARGPIHCEVQLHDDVDLGDAVLGGSRGTPRSLALDLHSRSR